MTERVPDTEAMKAFNAKVATEFRAGSGKVDALEGNELLLLTTTGARSGQESHHPDLRTGANLKIALRVVGARQRDPQCNPEWL